MSKRSLYPGGRLGLSGGSVDTVTLQKKYNILHMKNRPEQTQKIIKIPHMSKLKVSLKYYYYNYD